MFRSSTVGRLFQTSRHFLKVIPEAVTKQPITITIRTMSSSDRPNGLKANKGIELLTFGTPNGHKASIILEELKEAYGKEYTYQSVRAVDFSKSATS